MTNKMSVCSIKYTYTRYAGVDIEKYTRGIFEYAKEAFRELQPQMSEPGYETDTPDYLDILLFKKDGSNFCKTDIERRAVNIPRGYQLEGLVVEIHITNCDGTRHKKIHRMDGPDSDRILRQAHARSIRNKEQVEQSKICGCFSCCRIFPPSEITDYIPDEPPTAECPYCHIDSVIGDASGFPITKEFLKKMKKRWF